MQAASKTYRASSKPEKTITRGKNPWVEHVQRYRSTNRCTFGEALRGARATYQASAYRDGKKRVSQTVYGKSTLVKANRASVKGNRRTVQKHVSHDRDAKGIWEKFKKLLINSGDVNNRLGQPLDTYEPMFIYILKVEDNDENAYYVTASKIDQVMKIEPSTFSTSFPEARRLVGH